ncbi:MAG TPA: hypothetical protein VGS22_25410 [Thermoanaerobaculia bacterium]|jgi:hypothetical protein|nr:hypothetical protein [Thermoanaerobaculia bacterium]
MSLTRSSVWRPFFALAALFIMVGGPMHPRGNMAEMLGDHNWVLSHSLMLVGFLSLLVGLILYNRGVAAPERTRRWVRLAAIGTALQAIEMAFHTASVVDHDNLIAARATPVLTTHMWLAVALYPIFAALIIGLIIAGARDRSLGSPWISWLGILGAIAHGAAAPLTVAFHIPWAPMLFPFLLLLALWLLLTALWPSGSGVLARA